MIVKNYKSKFIRYLNEMAVVSGTHTNMSYNLEDNWNSIYSKQVELLKVITNKVPMYSIYLHGNSNYFLTDKQGNYKGHIGLVSTNTPKLLKDKGYDVAVKISSSNQDGSVKGFYNIMFTNILREQNIDCIISDNNLSTNAINSYSKLKGAKITPWVLTANNIEEFSKEVLLDDNNNVVVVTPPDDKLLEFTYNSYVTKITESPIHIDEYSISNLNNKISEPLFMMLYAQDASLRELI